MLCGLNKRSMKRKLRDNQMSNTEVLDKIRQAELKAEKMLEDAQKKKLEIIESAKKQALKMASEADESISKKTDAELGAFKKSLEKKKTLVFVFSKIIVCRS